MKQQSLLRVLIWFFMFCLCSSLLNAQTTYVVINTNDSGTGSLRQMVADAASGDIITFSELMPSDTITLTTGAIQLTKDLTIKGPGETMLTISGNNNSRIFIIPDATADHTISISGLTFSFGIADYGGAINNYSDNLTLEACTFINNEAEYGGGMSNYSSPAIKKCTFAKNNAIESGGGIVNFLSSSPTIEDCIFTENTCSTYGGGIYNSSSLSFPVIENCTFFNNESNYGGGVCNYSSSATIKNCIFKNNSSINGGGVYNCYSSSTIENCTFTGNYVTLRGGGVYNSSSSSTIKSCTCTGNHARYYGGGICNRSNSSSTIINCILYDNTAGITGNEVHNEDSDPLISHCDIAGCGGSTSWAGAEFGTDLGGNIDADPLFINSASDVHLQSASPCINTGSDAAAPPTDLDGYYRCGTADMGAYEFQFEMKWNGTADADWNNIANWQYIGLTGTPNALPGGGTDITIPITVNDPVINNPPESYAYAGGINIEPGAALTLQPGKCLTTEGPITNNGTLLLQSDPSGTASLITNSDVLGDISIQKNITDGTWHLIGAPVSSASARAFYADYLRYYENGAWVEVTNVEDPVYPLVGYALWGVAKNTTYTFSGTPNTGEMSIPVTADHSGWNLLSNPYPSAVDWSMMDDTYGAIYYWNPLSGSYENWVNGVGTGNPILPAMQGFWINAPVEGDFVINNDVRTHSDTEVYYKRESKTADPAIELIAFNDACQDHFHFLFTEESTAGFDLQYDAYKLLTDVDDVPQLFSLSNNERLSIDRRPECESIALGFSCITSGEFSLMLGKSNLLPTAILEDTKTGTFHDLATGAYSFAYLTDDDEDRFILHMNTTGIASVAANTANIYSYQKNITIANVETSDNTVLSVYNISGALVVHRILKGAQKYVVNTTLPSGIYVALLRTNTQVIKQKIHIQ